LDFGGIFLGRASSIFSPVASGYELKNGLASPKNLLAKTSNNLLNNVLSRLHFGQKSRQFLRFECDNSIIRLSETSYDVCSKRKSLKATQQVHQPISLYHVKPL
jgi:hypothetical protein